MSIFNLLSGFMAMKAAKTQAKSVQAGIDLQREQFQQSRQDMLPWMEAGQRSLTDIERELGTEYEQSKGYQWQVEEGQKAIRSNLAALGMTGSGAALKRLNEWGQGLAAQDYGTWYGRKAQLAGQGQQQSQALGGLGSTYGRAAAQQYGDLGAVRGSGYAALGNMFANIGEQGSRMLGAGMSGSGFGG